ncbi:MAG: carboxypeptidase regulatory-like domain-containing protein [Thermoplasmataceae archaeon]
MAPKEMRFKARKLTQDGKLNLKMARILAIAVAVFMLVIVMMPAGSSPHTSHQTFQNQMLPTVVHGYNVTFIEKGLPSGTTWMADMTNMSSKTPYSNTTTTAKNVVPLPNGTYTVGVMETVSPVDYSPYLGNTSLGYSNTQLSVDGKALTLNITFVRSYNVSFTESGLPVGNSSSWSISWKNTTQGYNASTQTLSQNSNGHTGINLTLANGTYQYNVNACVDGYYATHPSGNFTVSGSNLHITNIVFSNRKYTVTFNEASLPSGTPWAVTFNGHLNSSKTSTITFSAIPGTYSYTIGLAGIYQAQQDNGSITVSNNSTVSIAFSQVPYSPGNAKVFESLFPVGSYADYVQIGTGENNITYLSNNTIKSMPTESTIYFNYSVNAINDYVINISYTQTTISNGTNTTQTLYITTPTADIYNWAGYTPFANQTTPALLFVNTSDPASSYLPNSVNHSVSNTTISLLGKSHTAFKILGKIRTSNNGIAWNISYNVNYAQSNGMALMGDIHFNGNLSTFFYKMTANAEINVSLVSTNVASLTPLAHQYIKGTVSPGNATVTVDGRIIQAKNGNFNVSLLPGTYYLSFAAKGYSSSVKEITLQAGKTVTVNVALSPISNPVILSGRITPDTSNASLVINNIIVYVNSTGYYNLTVAPGTYTISAYENGYYPYSENVTVTSSRTVNIILAKEPSPTSGTHTGNANATGYNVTVTNLIIGKGNITLSFNSTGNGTLVVQIPFNDVGNATISEILNSTVYINGTQYKNFTITISSNYTIILKVYNLSSRDPTLYWGYSPYSTAPKTTPPTTTSTSQTPNLELYEIIAAIALIGIIAGTVGVLIRKKK